jgi:hypothetical protein
MSKFAVRNNANGAEPRMHIVVKRDEEEMIIAKLYSQANKEAYNADLERNHRLVVDMEEAAQAIATTLNMYEKLRRFNDESYDVVMDIFKPIIKQRIKYEKVLEFLAGPGKDDWV